MTIGDLRKILEGLPDDMPVFIESDRPFCVEPVEAFPTTRHSLYGANTETEPNDLVLLIT